MKLSEVSSDKAYVAKALDVARDMEQRGALAPRCLDRNVRLFNAPFGSEVRGARVVE